MALAILALGMPAGKKAQAIFIAGPDGSINTAEPDPDPGFSHVGTISGLSGVYVGNGWVLTANHVGIGTLVLDGVAYDPIPDSWIRIANPDPLDPDPDLIVFKLLDRPPLPDLMLASTPPAGSESVIMIGNGRNRGAEMTWNGLEGWEFAAGRTLRWGTNRIEAVGDDILIGSASQTRSFSMEFDKLRGPAKDDPEGQAVPGDSGGAVFAFRDGTPELIGLLFAQTKYDGQPDAAFFTQSSLAADLDFYGPQILAIVAQGDCEDGLDNDGDGLIDWPDDDGCEDATDASEVPEPGLGIGLLLGGGWLALIGRIRLAPVQASRFQRPRSTERPITAG